MNEKDRIHVDPLHCANCWIYSKGDTVSMVPEVKDHLGEVWSFACGQGKLDRLVRALDQACFPTYFGKPAVTHLMKDFAPHSFYFEIMVDGKMAMNGGVIYHASADDWSVHT